MKFKAKPFPELRPGESVVVDSRQEANRLFWRARDRGIRLHIKSISPTYFKLTRSLTNVL